MAASERLDRPMLLPTVHLVGKMQESGFVDGQWLIQRDGRFIQVTELLYRIAEQANGERTLDEIAAGVTASTDWMVTAAAVRQIVQTKLMPLGLITTADGTEASHGGEHARSLLQVNLRKRILGPRIVDPIAKVLQIFYAPPILILFLLAIATAHIWLYTVYGMADSLRAALYTPGGLLLVLAIMVVSGVFHEFGHAAGLRYGGGKVRGMGTGLYLVYPTFYTDTTDAYRLGRWGRLRTDLGGIYFHLIFALGIMALYFATGQEILLAAVVLISGDILYQLIPFVRLDGYWALADLLGIPDLFSQIGPFLRSLFPVTGSAEGRLPNLRPWVKTVFAIYILLTIPTLTLFFFLAVANFPHFMAIAWDSLFSQTRLFSSAYNLGDFVAMTAVVSQILLLMLAILGSVYLLYSISRTPIKALWHWSKPTLLRRAAGAFATAGAATLVTLLWSPHLPFAHRVVPIGPAGVESFEIRERDHVQTPVIYAQTPPVGGKHAPIWQNCGFYDTPIANEHAVHSLEHGAVWISYRPGLPKEQIDLLRRLPRRQTYILVSPYPGLPAPVIAAAWGHQLRLDSADDPRLDEFVRTFRFGPQAPERGGPCTGGVGVASRS